MLYIYEYSALHLYTPHAEVYSDTFAEMLHMYNQFPHINGLVNK